LSQIADRKGDLAGQAAALERALAIDRKNFAGDSNWTANTAGYLGEARIWQAREHEADVLLEEAEGMARRLGWTETAAQWHADRGLILERRGDLAGAMAAYDSAAQVFAAQKRKVQFHPEILSRRIALLARQGHAEQALADADQLIAEYDGLTVDFTSADVHAARSVALEHLGRAADAIAAQRRAVQILRDVRTSGWRERGAQRRLARLLVASGDAAGVKEAEGLLGAATPPADDPAEAGMQAVALAELAAAKGQPEQAARSAREAVALLDRRLPEGRLDDDEAHALLERLPKS
jgi:tetratricopeptide (TPR) repeat protein